MVVTAYSRYNKVKGVVRSTEENLKECKRTEQSLKKYLEEQGGSEVKSMQTRREGDLKQTEAYILTFNKLALRTKDHTPLGVAP